MTERFRSAAGVDRWEVGGEFATVPMPEGATDPLPARHRLFSIATHSVIALWRSLESQPTRRLHVPDYFCPEVIEAWQRAGISIVEFADDPRWPSPDLDRLAPTAGDAVLAVDYFGARDGQGWAGWHAAHPDTLLVEDHSHDPGSSWARGSSADYAFASLRKTLPVSDGAILWSPRGLPLPNEPQGPASVGSAVKRDAMVLKERYLTGGDVAHEAFRSLQLRGERELLADPPSPMAPWNVPLAEGGLPVAWRGTRETNVKALLRSIRGAGRLRPLFEAWPAGHCPFNVILVFEDQASRDACQRHLIERHIYPPVHWHQPAMANERVRDLADRILTVPVDQRYGPSDVERVAEAIMDFDRTYSSVRGAR